MIIYNKDWLDNRRVQDVAEKWFRKKLIIPAQLNDIQQRFVCGYKKTNTFIRIGMFLFTLLLANSAFGLVLLFLSGIISEIYGIVLLIFSGITFFVLEQFIKGKKYFHNGIDDMMLYIALSYFIGGIGALTYQVTDSVNFNNVLFDCIIILPVLIFCATRYADSFVSLLSFVCLLIIVFITVNKTGTIGKAVMPFIIMGVSFFVYWFSQKTKKDETKFYWRNCLNVLETASLITLYASVNYFVVREASALLFDLSLQPGEDIPLAIVFYVLTLAIPVAYIINGLKNKDRILLRTGIILLAVSVITYRYYYHFMEAEVAMIIAGAFLILGSWFVINKLKVPWKGIVDKDPNEDASFIEAESLLIAQTFGQQAVKPNDIEFGGGQFGGGGAGSNF
ncbi:MAG: hypothetical protein ABIT08_17130 [Bacteroidia bacterium]